MDGIIPHMQQTVNNNKFLLHKRSCSSMGLHRPVAAGSSFCVV